MVQVPMGRSWVSICGFARGVTPSAQNVMTSHVMTGSSERTEPLRSIHGVSPGLVAPLPTWKDTPTTFRSRSLAFPSSPAG